MAQSMKSCVDIWQRHSAHTCAAVQVSEAYHLHRDNDCRHYHYHRNHHHLGHQHPSSISEAASHGLSLACRLSSHLQPEPSILLLLSLELEPISKPAQSRSGATLFHSLLQEAHHSSISQPIKASQPSPNQSEIQILITQSKVQVNWTIQVLQRSAQLEKDSKVYKEWEYELWEHY